MAYVISLHSQSKVRDTNYQQAMKAIDGVIAVSDRVSDKEFLTASLSELKWMPGVKNVWINYSHCSFIQLDEECKVLEHERDRVITHVLESKNSCMRFDNYQLLSLPIIHKGEVVVIFTLQLKLEPAKDQIMLTRSIAQAIWQGMLRKHRNKKIREHEVFLSAATEQGGVGLFDWNLRTHCVQYSDVFLCQLGFTAEELKPHIASWTSCVNPEDLKVAKAYIDERLRFKARELTCDFRVTNKRGIELWMRVQASVFYNHKREAYRIVGAQMDISGQKDAEDRLLEERDQAQRLASRNDTILSSISDGIIEVDTTGKQVFINKAAASILGYPAEFLMGRNIEETWYRPSKIVKGHFDVDLDIFTALSTGEASDSDDWFVAANEHQIPVHRKVSPIYTDGAVSGAVISFYDIAQEVENTRAMKLSAAVYQNTAEGILITNSENKIVSVNPAFERITGYTSDEVIGQGPELLASSLTPDAVYKDLWGSLASKGSWKGELINRRKDGREFTELLSITTLKDDFSEQYYIGVLNDISKVKETQEQLAQLANHDRLTGIPNKFFFESLVGHLIEKDKRFKRKSALLYLDMDRFKNINDSMGHDYGDQLIIDCAQRLSGQIRDMDYCARLGGDEFAVFVDDYESEEDVYALADRLIQVISAPYNLEGCTSHIGMSIGIAFYPRDGRNLEELKRAADVALYKAKADGRGVYRTYSADMSDMAKERLELETMLREAMANDDLTLHYQPQVDIHTGKTIGFEALSRWQHSEQGFISPGKFIPLAEETGLISDLGRWALMRAAKQLKEWIDMKMEIGYVAVNVSALQLARTDLVADVKTAIAKYSIPASMLELEITESFLVHDPDKAADVLHELKALGVRISIDDFGTGFSSLGYIKDLPCDCIKIDQSFIRSITEEESDRSLVKAIIAMSKGLGLGVIAEGVETPEQVDLLRTLGCPVVQGWYYGKPRSPEAFNPPAKSTESMVA